MSVVLPGYSGRGLGVDICQKTFKVFRKLYQAEGRICETAGSHQEWFDQSIQGIDIFKKAGVRFSVSPVPPRLLLSESVNKALPGLFDNLLRLLVESTFSH